MLSLFSQVYNFFLQEEPVFEEPDESDLTDVSDAPIEITRRGFLAALALAAAEPFLNKVESAANLFAEEALPSPVIGSNHLTISSLQRDTSFTSTSRFTGAKYDVVVGGEQYTAHRIEGWADIPKNTVSDYLYKKFTYVVTDKDGAIITGSTASKAAFAANQTYEIENTKRVGNFEKEALSHRDTLEKARSWKTAANYTKPAAKALSSALVKGPVAIESVAKDVIDTVSKRALTDMVRALEHEADRPEDWSPAELKRRIKSGEMFNEAMMALAEDGVGDLEEAARLLREGEERMQIGLPLEYERAAGAAKLYAQGKTRALSAFAAMYHYHSLPKNFIADQVLDPIIAGVIDAGEFKPSMVVELLIEKFAETYKSALDKYLEKVAFQQVLQEQLYGYETFERAYQEVLLAIQEAARRHAARVAWEQQREALRKQTPQGPYRPVQPVQIEKNPAQQLAEDIVAHPERYVHIILGGYQPLDISLYFSIDPTRTRYTLDSGRYQKALDLIDQNISVIRQDLSVPGARQYIDHWKRLRGTLEDAGRRGYATPEEFQTLTGRSGR